VAVELAIHRWDAQHAIALHRDGSQPAPLDATIADAGIDEFVTEFLPGLLTAADSAKLRGVLQLRPPTPQRCGTSTSTHAPRREAGNTMVGAPRTPVVKHRLRERFRSFCCG